VSINDLFAQLFAGIDVLMNHKFQGDEVRTAYGCFMLVLLVIWIAQSRRKR